MKGLKTAIAAALFVSSAAIANPLAGLYGNTATSTSPDGKTYSYYFNADGSYEIHTPKGHVMKGTISWKDAQTACFQQTDPQPRPGDAESCKAFPVAHHAGDVWIEKDSDGVPYTNRIVAGRATN